MKILFINKYDISGGAGIAAFRLSKGLEELFHTENQFLVGIKKSDLPNIRYTRKPGFQNFLERGINFLFNQAGLQYKFLPFSSRRIKQITREFKPDIINLHNAHGGYFEISLLQELSQTAPIVWTLHDMWAFTANAAHTFGDTSWKELKSGFNENKRFPQIGLNTGKWLIKQKKGIYKNSDLTIVCPSRWLQKLAQQSPVFESKEILHIPNGIDLSIFRKFNKTDIKKELNIPDNLKVMVFAAEKGMKSEFKGGDDLIRILKGINEQLTEKVYLIILGLGNFEKINKFSNIIVHKTGYVFSEALIAKYLAAADVFIYPTKADNLPSALIESLACETPCITFDVGGCGEIIKNNFNGYLIKPFEIHNFVEKTLKLLNNDLRLEQFRTNARKSIEDNYSVQLMAERYYNLFSQLKKIKVNNSSENFIKS